jgi:transposase
MKFGCNASCFQIAKNIKRGPAHAAPDFAAVHEQLQRHKHVTLQLLWEEYRQASPDGTAIVVM